MSLTEERNKVNKSAFVSIKKTYGNFESLCGCYKRLRRIKIIRYLPQNERINDSIFQIKDLCRYYMNCVFWIGNGYRQ